MKKYLWVGILNLGLSQQCNMTPCCRHCQCGKKYDIDMSEEVMERTLDEVRYVDELWTMGGELMTQQGIKTLGNLNKTAKRKETRINGYLGVTNGTLNEAEYFREYKKLDKICNNKGKKQLGVSIDKFHQEAAIKYMGREKYSENLAQLFKNPQVTGVSDYCDDFIIGDGYAKDIDTDIPIINSDDFNNETLYLSLASGNGRELALVNNLTVHATGDVTNCPCFSELKAKSLGKVLNQSLTEIILNSPNTIICKTLDEYNYLEHKRWQRKEELEEKAKYLNRVSNQNHIK